MENKDFFTEIELKSDDNEEGVFYGYASTFGNMDNVNDIVEHGAFSESLRRREPKVLWQHDMSKPVGKVLEAREDAKGLFVRVKIAKNTTLGNDAFELIKEGIIKSLSIGFRVEKYEIDEEKGCRRIKKCELFEFSLVTIPANDEAEIMGFKSVPTNERDFEKFLRENGYSRSVAKAITARGIKGYQEILRDAGVQDEKEAPREVDDTKNDEVIKSLETLLKTLKGE